jgi:hypothetical protein
MPGSGMSVAIPLLPSYCYVCSVLCHVLFCVLFVCVCVLDNCHRDIRALFDYPNRFIRAFFSAERQMPGHNPQRRSTARNSKFTYQFFFFLIVMCAPSSVFCVLFVCKCVMHCCHRVSTQRQFNNNNNNNKYAFTTWAEILLALFTYIFLADTLFIKLCCWDWTHYAAWFRNWRGQWQEVY